MRSALTRSSAQPLRRRQPVDTRAARRSAARIVASRPSSTSIFCWKMAVAWRSVSASPTTYVFQVGLHRLYRCCGALGLAERCEAHGLEDEGAGGRHLLCSGGACLNVSFTQAPRRIDGVLFLWVGSVLLPHRSALLGIDARAALAPHNRERAYRTGLLDAVAPMIEEKTEPVTQPLSASAPRRRPRRPAPLAGRRRSPRGRPAAQGRSWRCALPRRRSRTGASHPQ